MKYSAGDIVLAKSVAGDAIPPIHVKLLKKIEVPERKGTKITWPGYIGWEAELVYESEAQLLRKKFRIPFKFPDEIETFVFESSIIKIKKRAPRKRKNPQPRSKQ